MNIYECLFTTDTSEITHKMAERVAYYSSSEREDRVDIFKLIKEAYSVRSRFFHGKESDEKTTLLKLNEMLKRLDSLTRHILTKVILEDSETFLKKDHELEVYFLPLCFRELFSNKFVLSLLILSPINGKFPLKTDIRDIILLVTTPTRAQ